MAQEIPPPNKSGSAHSGNGETRIWMEMVATVLIIILLSVLAVERYSAIRKNLARDLLVGVLEDTRQAQTHFYQTYDYFTSSQDSLKLEVPERFQLRIEGGQDRYQARVEKSSTQGSCMLKVKRGKPHSIACEMPWDPRQ